MPTGSRCVPIASILKSLFYLNKWSRKQLEKCVEMGIYTNLKKPPKLQYQDRSKQMSDQTIQN